MGEGASRARVVILGGGFAGLEAAKALAAAPVEVTLIDRQNHHLFQPLLYQVATAALAPADVAWPIRGVLSDQRNARVLMAEAGGIDLAARRVRTTAGEFAYDFLVVATGATHAYFGHDDWAAFAPGLKRIEDATAIRRRILMAFERAELEDEAAARQALTTFVVVGGGPTGVEMAGAIADIARHALPPDFRRVDPAAARVLLIEAGPRILPAFPEALSAYAQRALTRMGVEVRTGTAVTGVDAAGVLLGGERVAAGAVVWAAGVQASPAGSWLGAAHDRAGRVEVGPDLTVPGHPEVFVVGDTAAAKTEAGRPIPGLAPAAKQMGRFAGETIAARVGGRSAPVRFRYRHQGDLATIGRKAAIVSFGRLTLTGFLGWAFWSVVHVYFLIGLRNRIAVALSWLWDYVTFGRKSRLITEPARG
ncbi:MAG TPA: NAD(P)/FAD-dependent oxidoreductase [Phenylobacterium sp.]|uniref:NAD(P)/FAD-dependent oxidoreductase n=1 Tax=Phenylobacterium sp. TaxID=1871053 RepID=UPI002B48E77D|nr:NAD(P)/FAD-dependent oxidoreductase [Phenylobacterium sp.]HKR90506.1 NAD(P)/FAD-dependent oxidoreductase [Phenylobacterium sp.]